MSTNVFPLFKLKREEDFADVFAFMQQHFRVQEPITRALDTKEEESADFYTDLCNGGFKTAGISFGVRNADGELIAVALNGRCTHEELGRTPPVDKRDFTQGPSLLSQDQPVVCVFAAEIGDGPYTFRNANRLLVFIEHVEAGLFAHLPPNARIFKMDILAVRADYCRRRIASALLSASLQAAREAGCTHVATCATAQASQRLFKSRGFQTVRCVRFADFLDQTRAVYSGVHDGGDAARMMLLELS
ncbi:hypothetical protein M3Y99_01437700 [Aphelenchoides fujianensis]|nr:hypothetical protein M3Y99_01437700 [Aphelenchoides fujianensis]